MRNSPLVRTALLPSLRTERNRFRSARLLRRKISLRWIPEQNQCFGYVSSFCQAKEGKCQRSTQPPEPPIGRAASIRTCPASRKPGRLEALRSVFACGLCDQTGAEELLWPFILVQRLPRESLEARAPRGARRRAESCWWRRRTRGSSPEPHRCSGCGQIAGNCCWRLPGAGCGPS
jgi:hypothetical protein